MRLIDADELRKESKMLYSIHAFEPIEAYTQDQIDNAPTIDAVLVIRCDKCDSYKNRDKRAHVGWCKVSGFVRQDDDFCSYGERKDGGN